MLFEVLELDKITKKWVHRAEDKPEKENKTKIFLTASLVNGIPGEIVK